MKAAKAAKKKKKGSEQSHTGALYRPVLIKGAESGFRLQSHTACCSVQWDFKNTALNVWRHTSKSDHDKTKLKETQKTWMDISPSNYFVFQRSTLKLLSTVNARQRRSTLTVREERRQMSPLIKNRTCYQQVLEAAATVWTLVSHPPDPPHQPQPPT